MNMVVEGGRRLAWPALCRPAGPAHSIAKRGLDIVLAALLLLLTAPLLLLAMLAVKLESAGPAIFRQRRIGYRCEEFVIYKLRTMVDGADRQEEELASRCARTFLKIEEDSRTTVLGRFLRRTSIDELPQLWNVLRGDMSLVGPRPILLSDFRKMPKREQWRRFTARPGISGLWQVNGRSRCSDERRLALDLRYVRDWSLRLDLEILLTSVPVVLRGDGAS